MNVDKQSHYVGFIGPIGSGKSTACSFFKEKGYHVVSLSDIIRVYVQDNNLSDDRDTLTKYSNELKRQHGLTYFAEKTYENVVDNQFDHVVFDSIRHPDEANYLKQKGVFLVGIRSAQNARFNRILQRQHGTDFVDLETFVEQDNNELTGVNQGQNVEGCYKFCDLVITNNQSLDYFMEELNKILIALVS
tara:strand:+ start:11043 stop:11612 length:570 start_codon:yes stop_codon:yes gene_type:complete